LSNEQVLEVVRACHTHDPALGLLIEVLQHVPTGVNRDSQGAPKERV
jgi:hypothetical protein